MAQIIVYERETGKIINHWNGHPNDKDELTSARQQEMLELMYPERFYEVGMAVTEGDNAIFLPDYIEPGEESIGKKTYQIKKIKKNKLKQVNSYQRIKGD